ncbi:STY0301 family protein [Herbaspirillum sp. RTI4]|uniref:STY0301 family protein n=1 Tax=Herbaspirillum sp. RTI4 TaxID=3048640 RepID=UPI002AB4ACA9|nr:STY0301 family protein [Herbaspirillum sp. RTI4]MDY7576999.1 STY0301 family protein [Herbaspirillum sp. RTI4]MEA9982098.1 hypothetical protein [Herbaspirillum sp. RTI4]
MINRYVLPFICLVPLQALAAAIEINCPAAIEVNEVVNSPEPSWEVAQDRGRGGHRLNLVSVYSGPPQEMANLVPDKILQKKQQRKSLWKLTPSEHRYWVACSYTNSLTLLARELPENIRQCEVTEAVLPSGQTLGVAGWVCK